MRRAWSLLLLLASLVLASCGFTPSGNINLTHLVPELYLQSSDPYGDLSKQLNQQLRWSGVQLLNQPNEFRPVLSVGNVRSEKRTVSLYSDASPAEYALSYSVPYSIRWPDGSEQRFTFHITRDFVDNPEEALAKSREYELLLQEINQAAAYDIIRTLGASAEHENLSRATR